MTKLKIMAAIGAAALMTTSFVATSATAQPWRDNDRGYNNYNRGYSEYAPGDLSTSHVDALEWRINNAPLPPGERRALMREWRQIQPLAWRVQTGQASRWEYDRLARGVARIEQATRYAGVDRRDRRYGYNNRY